MAVAARATLGELQNAVGSLNAPPFEMMREPEIGLVMIRGRVGGDGAPFNLGEATVTRATLRLATGELGFGYVLGRDSQRARLTALLDALWQKGEQAAIEQLLISPVCARLSDEQSKQAEQTQATKVNFFTLVRGED